MELAVLDSVPRFHAGHGHEGPAGTALALVTDWVKDLPVSPVNLGGVVSVRWDQSVSRVGLRKAASVPTPVTVNVIAIYSKLNTLQRGLIEGVTVCTSVTGSFILAIISQTNSGTLRTSDKVTSLT